MNNRAESSHQPTQRRERQIRRAWGLSIESPVIYNTADHDASFSISDQVGEFDFDLPNTKCTGPLVMCVHVIFKEKEGEVIFAGAGAWFEERT